MKKFLLLKLQFNLNETLLRCTKLLRAKEYFDASKYEKLDEIYKQVSVFIFGEQGLTPYKLKLILMWEAISYEVPEKICAKLLRNATTMRTRIFKIGQCEAEEDCLTKIAFLEMFFFRSAISSKLASAHALF